SYQVKEDRLAKETRPPWYARAWDSVTDGLSGGWSNEKPWLKSLANTVIPGAFPEETRTPGELLTEMRTAVVRWGISNVAEPMLKVAALAGATSTDAVVGGGFFPRVEQNRQEVLATIPSMSIDRPMYVDGSYDGYGRNFENFFDLGMN